MVSWTCCWSAMTNWQSQAPHMTGEGDMWWRGEEPVSCSAMPCRAMPCCTPSLFVHNVTLARPLIEGRGGTAALATGSWQQAKRLFQQVRQARGNILPELQSWGNRWISCCCLADWCEVVACLLHHRRLAQGRASHVQRSIWWQLQGTSTDWHASHASHRSGAGAAGVWQGRSSRSGQLGKH